MYRFTEDCLTGIAQIDEEHEGLFTLMNEIMDLLHNEMIEDKYNQIKEVFAKLQEYADNHFEHEELYMESINDPELASQKKQHDAFREKMDMMDIANIDDNESQREALEDLMIYLTRWLYRHILSSDIMIGKMPPAEEWRNQENPCEFTELYATGIDLIDGEHSVLFDIIREANNLVKDEFLHDKYDEITTILDKLKTYTQDHFKDEEEYMESIQYTGIEAQKRAHRAFEEKLEEIDLEQIDENQQEYLEELMEFLFGWLANHILKMDKRIGDFEK